MAIRKHDREFKNPSITAQVPIHKQGEVFIIQGQRQRRPVKYYVYSNQYCLIIYRTAEELAQALRKRHRLFQLRNQYPLD